MSKSNEASFLAALQELLKSSDSLLKLVPSDSGKAIQEAVLRCKKVTGSVYFYFFLESAAGQPSFLCVGKTSCCREPDRVCQPSCHNLGRLQVASLTRLTKNPELEIHTPHLSVFPACFCFLECCWSSAGEEPALFGVPESF